MNFLTPDWFQIVINDDKRLQTTIVLHSLCTITHIFEAMQKNNFEKFSKFRISRHFHPYKKLPGVLIFGAVKCLKEVKSRFLFPSKMRFWCALFFSEISDHVSNCDFGAFSNDSNKRFWCGFSYQIGVRKRMSHTISNTNKMEEYAPKMQF